ncbi:hypothetical protein JST97_00960 [bacterium]|nr:hypothetical protein [bacterium]
MGKVVRLAALWGLLVFFCRGWTVLGLRYQLEYGEGHMLGLAYFLKNGHSIYHPAAEPPWVYGLHLPFYLWLMGLFLGPQPDFLPGRLISFLAVLTALVLSIGWLWRRRGGLCASAALTFMLVHPLILGWAPLARVDNLGFALSVVAILLARPHLSIWFCALAFLTKQSFVAAPLALAWWFGRPSGTRFLGTLAIGLALVLMTLRLPPGGGLVSSWGEAWMLWSSYFLSILPLLALAWLAPKDLEETQRLRAYALAALIPAAACLKQGSYYNYFLELHWALSMLAGLALARPHRAVGLLTAAQFGLGSLTQFPILHSPIELFHYETLPTLSGRRPWWLEQFQAYDQLGPLLEQHPGPVLAEQCGNPLLFGREPLVCDCYALLMDQARSGQWNPSPLIEMIRQRKIALILLQRLGPENARVPGYVMQPILENYEVIGQLGQRGDFILLPKTRNDSGNRPNSGP